MDILEKLKELNEDEKEKFLIMMTNDCEEYCKKNKNTILFGSVFEHVSIMIQLHKMLKTKQKYISLAKIHLLGYKMLNVV